MKNTKRNVIYADIQRHWRKLGPIFRSKECRSVWVPCMTEYMQQRSSGKWKFKYDPGKYRTPSCFDSCDWRWNRNRRGPHPEFWDYACHSACHWVVDMCLYVAISYAPHLQWRIISSDKHSTVWNGSLDWPVLFDVNFLALGVAPDEAWNLAHSKGTKTLKPHHWMKWYNVPRRLRE